MPELTEQERLNLAMQVVEGYTTILLACKSYREQCLAQGFSETAAEVMAMDLHSRMLKDT